MPLQRLLFIIWLTTIIPLYAGCAGKVEKTPVARKGILDLRYWDFSAMGAADLQGEWKFQWMRESDTIASPGLDDSQWDIIDVPGKWNDKTGRYDGFAWFRLKVLLPAKMDPEIRNNMGILLNEVATSFSLFIDNRMVMSSGIAGNTRESTIPRMAPVIDKITLAEGQKEILIAIKVSNFHHARGGIKDKPKLGIYNKMRTNLWLNDMRDMIILGILLMMIIYQVLLWSRRQEDRASFYFALCCVVIFFRIISADNFLERFFPNLNVFEIRYKLEYLAISLGWAAFATFFQKLYPEEFHKWVVRTLQVLGIIIGLFTLIVPCRIYSAYVKEFYHSILVLSCIYCIIAITIATRRAREGPVMMLFSFLIFFITIINDILYSYTVIFTTNLSQVGLILMILSQSSVLSRRYANALKTSARNEQLERELEIARLIQKKIMPQALPDLQGYRLYMTYKPMDKVGGDFYDCSVKKDRIELVIADVSGHGLPGAFLSFATKMSLEKVGHRINTKRMIRNLNHTIYNSAVQDNFVTVFFCVINTRSNVMRFTNAGHFPPLLYRPSQDIFMELNSKGMALGWFENIEVEEKKMKLEPGDRIVLYTDGITECMNHHHELYGDYRLKQFIRNNMHLNPDDFSKQLIKSLRDFSHSNTDSFDDDLTMIVFDIL